MKDRLVCFRPTSKRVTGYALKWILWYSTKPLVLLSVQSPLWNISFDNIVISESGNLCFVFQMWPHVSGLGFECCWKFFFSLGNVLNWRHRYIFAKKSCKVSSTNYHFTCNRDRTILLPSLWSGHYTKVSECQKSVFLSSLVEAFKM